MHKLKLWFIKYKAKRIFKQIQKWKGNKEQVSQVDYYGWFFDINKKKYQELKKIENLLLKDNEKQLREDK